MEVFASLCVNPNLDGQYSKLCQVIDKKDQLSGASHVQVIGFVEAQFATTDLQARVLGIQLIHYLISRHAFASQRRAMISSLIPHNLASIAIAPFISAAMAISPLSLLEVDASLTLLSDADVLREVISAGLPSAILTLMLQDRPPVDPVLHPVPLPSALPPPLRHRLATLLQRSIALDLPRGVAGAFDAPDVPPGDATSPAARSVARPQGLRRAARQPRPPPSPLSVPPATLQAAVALLTAPALPHTIAACGDRARAAPLALAAPLPAPTDDDYRAAYLADASLLAAVGAAATVAAQALAVPPPVAAGDRAAGGRVLTLHVADVLLAAATPGMCARISVEYGSSTVHSGALRVPRAPPADGALSSASAVSSAPPSRTPSVSASAVSAMRHGALRVAVGASFVFVVPPNAVAGGVMMVSVSSWDAVAPQYDVADDASAPPSGRSGGTTARSPPNVHTEAFCVQVDGVSAVPTPLALRLETEDDAASGNSTWRPTGSVMRASLAVTPLDSTIRMVLPPPDGGGGTTGGLPLAGVAADGVVVAASGDHRQSVASDDVRGMTDMDADVVAEGATARVAPCLAAYELGRRAGACYSGLGAVAAVAIGCLYVAALGASVGDAKAVGGRGGVPWRLCIGAYGWRGGPGGSLTRLALHVAFASGRLAPAATAAGALGDVRGVVPTGALFYGRTAPAAVARGDATTPQPPTNSALAPDGAGPLPYYHSRGGSMVTDGSGGGEGTQPRRSVGSRTASFRGRGGGAGGNPSAFGAANSDGPALRSGSAAGARRPASPYNTSVEQQVSPSLTSPARSGAGSPVTAANAAAGASAVVPCPVISELLREVDTRQRAALAGVAAVSHGDAPERRAALLARLRARERLASLRALMHVELAPAHPLLGTGAAGLSGDSARASSAGTPDPAGARRGSTLTATDTGARGDMCASVELYVSDASLTEIAALTAAEHALAAAAFVARMREGEGVPLPRAWRVRDDALSHRVWPHPRRDAFGAWLCAAVPAVLALRGTDAARPISLSDHLAAVRAALPLPAPPPITAPAIGIADVAWPIAPLRSAPAAQLAVWALGPTDTAGVAAARVLQRAFRNMLALRDRLRLRREAAGQRQAAIEARAATAIGRHAKGHLARLRYARMRAATNRDVAAPLGSRGASLDDGMAAALGPHIGGQQPHSPGVAHAVMCGAALGGAADDRNAPGPRPKGDATKPRRRFAPPLGLRLVGGLLWTSLFAGASTAPPSGGTAVGPPQPAGTRGGRQPPAPAASGTKVRPPDFGRALPTRVPDTVRAPGAQQSAHVTRVAPLVSARDDTAYAAGYPPTPTLAMVVAALARPPLDSLLIAAASAARSAAVAHASGNESDISVSAVVPRPSGTIAALNADRAACEAAVAAVAPVFPSVGLAVSVRRVAPSAGYLSDIAAQHADDGDVVAAAVAAYRVSAAALAPLAALCDSQHMSAAGALVLPAVSAAVDARRTAAAVIVQASSRAAAALRVAGWRFLARAARERAAAVTLQASVRAWVAAQAIPAMRVAAAERAHAAAMVASHQRRLRQEQRVRLLQMKIDAAADDEAAARAAAQRDEAAARRALALQHASAVTEGRYVAARRARAADARRAAAEATRYEVPLQARLRAARMAVIVAIGRLQTAVLMAPPPRDGGRGVRNVSGRSSAVDAQSADGGVVEDEGAAHPDAMAAIASSDVAFAAARAVLLHAQQGGADIGGASPGAVAAACAEVSALAAALALPFAVGAVPRRLLARGSLQQHISQHAASGSVVPGGSVGGPLGAPPTAAPHSQLGAVSVQGGASAAGAPDASARLAPAHSQLGAAAHAARVRYAATHPPHGAVWRDTLEAATAADGGAGAFVSGVVAQSTFLAAPVPPLASFAGGHTPAGAPSAGPHGAVGGGSGTSPRGRASRATASGAGGRVADASAARDGWGGAGFQSTAAATAAGVPLSSMPQGVVARIMAALCDGAADAAVDAPPTAPRAPDGSSDCDATASAENSDAGSPGDREWIAVRPAMSPVWTKAVRRLIRAAASHLLAVAAAGRGSDADAVLDAVRARRAVGAVWSEALAELDAFATAHAAAGSGDDRSDVVGCSRPASRDGASDCAGAAVRWDAGDDDVFAIAPTGWLGHGRPWPSRAETCADRDEDDDRVRSWARVRLHLSTAAPLATELVAIATAHALVVDTQWNEVRAEEWAHVYPAVGDLVAAAIADAPADAQLQPDAFASLHAAAARGPHHVPKAHATRYAAAVQKTLASRAAALSAELERLDAAALTAVPGLTVQASTVRAAAAAAALTEQALRVRARDAAAALQAGAVALGLLDPDGAVAAAQQRVVDATDTGGAPPLPPGLGGPRPAPSDVLARLSAPVIHSRARVAASGTESSRSAVLTPRTADSAPARSLTEAPPRGALAWSLVEAFPLLWQPLGVALAQAHYNNATALEAAAIAADPRAPARGAASPARGKLMHALAAYRAAVGFAMASVAVDGQGANNDPLVQTFTAGYRALADVLDVSVRQQHVRHHQNYPGRGTVAVRPPPPRQSHTQHSLRSGQRTAPARLERLTAAPSDPGPRGAPQAHWGDDAAADASTQLGPGPLQRQPPARTKPKGQSVASAVARRLPQGATDSVNRPLAPLMSARIASSNQRWTVPSVPVEESALSDSRRDELVPSRPPSSPASEPFTLPVSPRDSRDNGPPKPSAATRTEPIMNLPSGMSGDVEDILSRLRKQADSW